MIFFVEHNEQTYFVEVEELKNDNKSKVIFNNFGCDEYEIKIFLAKEEKHIPVIVTELPLEFQESLANLLHSILPNIKTFVANPYFDEVIIFFGNTIFTSQEKLKPIHCPQCEVPNLYEKRDKDNKTEFVQNVRAKLKADPNAEWPFKGNLMIQFTVSDTTARLKKVDLDNLSKSILDSLNEIVFDDDNQIVAFAADKWSVKDIKAYIVAIKKLLPNEKPKFQEFLFSSDRFSWDEEYQEKIKQNKPTRFSNFKFEEKNILNIV